MVENENLASSVIPLYLVHLAGGTLKGRTRLQKLVFLSQKKMNDAIDFEFVKGWYGPVSYRLMELIHDLTEIGLIKEHVGETRAGLAVADYRLTKAGQDFVKLALAKRMITIRTRAKVEEAFHEYGRLPFVEMLARVHAEYPQWIRNK